MATQRVEPSGVIFKGECNIQTSVCTAKTPAAITAVWTIPERDQIDVCRYCLEEMIRTGEWEIQGARLTRHADIAVCAQDGTPILIVEVKRRPFHDRDLTLAAMRIHRNMLAHSGIPPTRYFMLALFPSPFYLWTESSLYQSESQPDFIFDVEDQLAKYSSPYSGEQEYVKYEKIIAAWLLDLLASEEQYDMDGWTEKSGFRAAIKDGKVIQEYRY